MRGTLVAIAVAWLWLGLDAAPAEAQCGNGKVDVSFRHTCAPCVAGNTNCPCADVREPLEPCDGRDFDGATCQTQGFFAGTLRCTKTCKLDTSRCTNLPSDLKLLHRSLGAAPASASLAFNTNVISVGAAGASGTTITPYNWDLRGPWGKASSVTGQANVVSGVLALARNGKALELVQHDYQGVAKAVHSFGDRVALAWTMGFRDGVFVAFASGAGASELVLVDDNGKARGKPVRVAGVVRAMSWHQEGYVVAYEDGKGDLRVSWFDAAAVRLADGGIGPTSASVAIAPMYPLRAVVVRGGAAKVTATIVTLDAKKGIAVEADLPLLEKPARVVAAGYAGSVEGNYAILDDGKGGIHAARIHEGKATVKLLVRLRGAIAYAATTGYQHVYVAWCQGKQLYLTRFSAFLQ